MGPSACPDRDSGGVRSTRTVLIGTGARRTGGLPCPAPRGRRDSPQPEPDRTTPCGRLRGRTTRRAVDQAASRAGSHDHDATGRRLRPERRACALQKKVRWIRYPCKLDGSGFVTAVCAFGRLRPLGHDVLLCSWSCGHRRLSASQADVGSGRLSKCRAAAESLRRQRMAGPGRTRVQVQPLHSSAAATPSASASDQIDRPAMGVVLLCADMRPGPWPGIVGLDCAAFGGPHVLFCFLAHRVQ
jgi:hypothetical protein